MRGIRRVRFYCPGQVQRCGDVPGWQKGPEAPHPVGAPPSLQPPRPPGGITVLGGWPVREGGIVACLFVVPTV